MSLDTGRFPVLSRRDVADIREAAITYEYEIDIATPLSTVQSGIQCISALRKTAMGSSGG